MKKSILLYLVLSVIFLVRCKTAPKELEENEILNAKSLIEVVNVTYGTVDDELTFSASTIYLNRNVITATIPSFITRVRVKLGDAVSKGDILFELESKEKRALGKSGAQLDSSLTKFGMVEIRASASGVISTLDKQQAGDYVLEGTQLCTIAESSDLAFQVNVPYEFTAYTRQGNACTIQLPDGTLHQATFTKALTGMNTMAQTQTILAKVNEAVFLPENMIVKVSVIKGSSSKRQLLPKSCILAMK